MAEKIKKLADIRKENEELRQKISFLRMNNFEKELQCNRMKNQLDIVNKIALESATKMNNVAGNMQDLLSSQSDTSDPETGGPEQSEPIQNENVSDLLINNNSTTTETAENKTFIKEKGKTRKTSQNASTSEASNEMLSSKQQKTQLVTPHSVNGTVLFNPVVNISRLSHDHLAEHHIDSD